jgi:hypothetical protein
VYHDNQTHLAYSLNQSATKQKMYQKYIHQETQILECRFFSGTHLTQEAHDMTSL